MIKLTFRCIAMLFVIPLLLQEVRGNEVGISDETEECLICHSELHPGLVASWKLSLHSKANPRQAMTKDELSRRMSSAVVDSSLMDVTVGCYECHSLNTDVHKDAFEHNGYVINVVVSSNDCATCHGIEAEQFSRNIMAHAYSNLVDNSLYQDFIKSVNNPYEFTGDDLEIGLKNDLTEYESCLYCHGTQIEVDGIEERETDFGDMSFPVLIGWPNQGVGRVNPDGSKGACTACHPRHDFSIETARKPYTCAECHKGPDVPAFKVYEVSKHGNIFKSKSDQFDFQAVPWTVGSDFTAPTCATCHASLLVTPDNTVIAERTHQYNDRLSWRLFGVPYAHPHPIDADLKHVRNSIGLPIFTELNGDPVAELVISEAQQQEHNTRMKSICQSCHSNQWVDGHFLRLENTIHATNEITHEATKIMMDIWMLGQIQGIPQGSNAFDEESERIWTSIWLFYANSTRFASAMAGGGDYGVFANGRYQTTEQLYRLFNLLQSHESAASHGSDTEE